MGGDSVLMESRYPILLGKDVVNLDFNANEGDISISSGALHLTIEGWLV
jgi:hypothetical protein